MLRYAPRFPGKIKKKSEKKFQKNFREFFFQFFFGYHGFTSNLEQACEYLGGLGPLVWEEIENGQTVHKPKLKFKYRWGTRFDV
jgi:hypothetical protein